MVQERGSGSGKMEKWRRKKDLVMVGIGWGIVKVSGGGSGRRAVEMERCTEE